MNKLLATIVLSCFSLVANGQENVNLKPKNLLSLFCSETNNKNSGLDFYDCRRWLVMMR